MKKRDSGRGNRVGLSSLGFTTVLIVLLALLVFSILASITFGNADLSVKEVYSVVAYELLHIRKFSDFAEGAVHDVVWIIRFPRVILALCVGMGLAVCGVVMQAVVKNPLADPYVLGISSGASLGATIGVLFGFGALFGANSVGVMAFLGASSVCSAIGNFAIYIVNNKNATSEIMFWTMGSLAGAKWQRVGVLLPVVFIGTLIFWSQFRNLNLMLLGDEASITLGTDLHRARNLYMILSSLMVGFAVYAAGTIGFVGLIVPHAVRMIFGTDHRRLVPLCALVGAIFLIWADVGCRVILKNSEMPIGILVSIIGAPCFIYLMVRRSYGFGGGRG